MKIGDIIKRTDLNFKRPGNGIEPGELKYILGRKLKNDKKFDEMINWEDLI